MKIISPRSSLSLDYTPKQWVGFMNTCLLLFVTFMFGLVVYNMRTIDQQLIRVLDTSVVAIDLLATFRSSSHRQTTTPYWRTVGRHNLTVYSAFCKEDKVLMVGSSPRTTEPVIDEDLRCFIEYEDEVDVGLVDYRRVSDCSQTTLLFCSIKEGAVPKKVALASDDDPKQWMDVVGTTRNNATFESPKTAACVRPLQGDESVKDVAEFVAFYETVGVDHIYFYDRGAKEEVVDFLLELEEAGHSVSHFQWNRDDPEDCPVTWSEHVQDCVHRGSGRYSDVVTVGVSDFLIPADYFRLPEMLEQIRLSPQASRLRLRSANFCADPLINLGDVNIIDFGKMTVRGELKPSDSNYIIRLDPEGVLGFEDQISDVTLPGSDVIVHRHSKSCDTSGLLKDFTAFKYSHIVEQSDVLKLYRRSSM